MNITADKLYDLLPAIYRIRDAERGEPLKALLSVMASQIHVVEEDIDRLYENWFIETCEGWLVPYLGDLLGVRPLRGADADIFSLRAYVANTLAYRRRKGTVAVLEELARDVTGWPAKAVEFFELVALSQHLNHLRLHKPASVQISSKGARSNLELFGRPFEKAAHTADVRRIANGRGKYNLSQIGLYLWRLKAYKVLRATARAADDAPTGCYRFNPLGYDAPLFNPPQTEESITHLAEEINVPDVLRRLPLYLELTVRRKAIDERKEPTAYYFGEDPVFEIFLDNAAAPLAPDEIVIGNLAEWERSGWKPPKRVAYGNNLKTKCVVDPALGRLALQKGVSARSVQATYSYGFSDNVGGGPYDRRRSVAKWYDPQKRPVTWQREVTQVGSGQTLRDAVVDWNIHSRTHRRACGLIFITDSCSYPEELPEINIPRDGRLAVVAAQCPACDRGTSGPFLTLTPDNLRPHILSDLILVREPEPIGTVPDDSHGEFIADGLLVEGALTVKSCDLGLLRLAHCTIVSTPSAQIPSRPQPGVTIASGNTSLKVILDHCLTEAICASESILRLIITDSLIDAGGKERNALAGLTGDDFGPVTEIERSTLLGKSFIRELYASEAIFTGEIKVQRCQRGCLRFSWLALPENPQIAPQTPPRYRCQPCLDIALQDEDFRAKGMPVDPTLIRKRVSLWLTPAFTSGRYGHPAYGQLSLLTPIQIRTGAEDGSEMGVFCHLKQSQREADLRGTFAEYLRSGLAAGILYARQEKHQTPGGSK